jgi:SAM-dependent methyltransferase
MPLRARHHCNICDRRIRRFLPYRGGWSALPPLSRNLKIVGSDVENFECPACGCHDRERHLLMYLKAAGLLETMKGARILHLAPEHHLQRFIGDAAPGEYVLGDLCPSRPGIEQVDLQDVPFPDAYFDFVIANHVLEHVQDDGRALGEIVRVLRPGGHAILQTPYSPVLTRTFEDAAIDTAEACLHAFGQEDHRRLYGRDIVERIASYGLSPRVQYHSTLLAGVDPARHGLNREEPFFLFQKGPQAPEPAAGPQESARNCGPMAQEATGTLPLLSILCITYNHERYIRQALDSFLMQEVRFPFEIVIGDDCSTDATVQVIEEYQAKHPGIIKLLPSRFNLGMTQNFRRAMKACRGRYIAICEGDDFWEDATKLAKQVKFLEGNPGYVITYHDAQVLDKSGHRGGLQLPVELQCDSTPDELARTRPISTLTVCFRNLLDDIPAEFNHVPALDLCLWSLLGQFGAGKYMPEIKPAVYRVHDGGVFSTQTRRNRLRMTACTYLCLAQFHENRGNGCLGGYFAFEAASIIGGQLETPSQRRLVRNLVGAIWHQAKARIAGVVRRYA